MSAYVHKQTYIRMLVAAIFKIETTQVSINRKWVKKKKKKGGILTLWNTHSNKKE